MYNHILVFGRFLYIFFILQQFLPIFKQFVYLSAEWRKKQNKKANTNVIKRHNLIVIG